MKILKLFFILSLIIPIYSCSDSEEIPEPQEENNIIDLSKDEMANCYIVQSPGVYKFKADNQFNLGEGLPVPPVISPVSAGLVWQTVKSSVVKVEFNNEGKDPYIVFEVANPIGNALIAVYDEAGTILWGWHIWMPEESISSISTSTGYEIMNMNLGAVNNNPGDAASYGMLYQWGRKDPFPASETLTGTTATIGAPLYDIDNNTVEITHSDWISLSANTLEYAMANPTVVISNNAQYTVSRDWLQAGFSDDSLWGNPNGDKRDEAANSAKFRKTCYDPSPAGWMVPPADVFSNLTTTGGYAWTFEDFNVKDINNDGDVDLDDYNYGWHFMVGNVSSYFSAASRYDGQYAMLMGSMSGLWGNYWSSAPYSSTPGCASCCLAFQVKSLTGQEMITVSPSAGASKADAYSIRCIRQ